MIPMVDLKGQYSRLKEEINHAIQSVLESGEYIFGPQVEAFEKETANYLGVKHAISCASGTDALHLALRASGVGIGDEVITTAFTFIATAEAISYIGARPVFAEIDPYTFNITPESIEAVLTKRTKAIIPVHLFGQPADMPSILSLCEHHQLIVIEDCAQSFGASIGKRKTGSFGIAAGFSFFPSKNLGAYGDGGLVTTSSDILASTVKKLRNHGSEARYYHDAIGYNSRLDAIQAAVLRVKLRYIDTFNAQRRTVAGRYSELMKDLPIKIPYEDGVGQHVYHQYTILLEQRDTVIHALQQSGIASAIYYPIPLHKQQVFHEAYKGIVLPVTEETATRCLSLPMYPELSDSDLIQTVSTIKKALGA